MSKAAVKREWIGAGGLAEILDLPPGTARKVVAAAGTVRSRRLPGLTRQEWCRRDVERLAEQAIHEPTTAGVD